MKKAFFLIVFISAIGSDATAEIYKFKNSKGQIEYSTTPPPSASIKSTGIQTEYSKPAIPVELTKKLKPQNRKEPETSGPQVINIDGGNDNSNGCDTASNGYLSEHGAAGDTMQTEQWKRCRGMK